MLLLEEIQINIKFKGKVTDLSENCAIHLME